MKKIMFYINAIHHGGAERVIVNLATQFAQHNYKCVLVTSFVDTWEYPVNDCVKRISLSESTIKNFLKRNIEYTKRLRNVILTEKPDVLISFMAEPNFRALIATIGLKTKNIISVRNAPDREYNTAVTKFLAKTLFRKADGVVFQTEDAKKWFPIQIQKKSRIIFNQVDNVFYNTTYTGVRHGIVTTGRLTPQKNHKILIKAFAKIADQINDKLYIYGDGELREELEQLIADLNMKNRIFLPGSTKNVAETIKSAKLFVLSSDYEGMPNSLMEAMALGLPCISTDCPCGGSRSIISNGENGVLIACTDLDNLANTMLELLYKDDFLNIIAQSARNTATVLFEPNRIFKLWETYVLSV